MKQSEHNGQTIGGGAGARTNAASTGAGAGMKGAGATNTALDAREVFATETVAADIFAADTVAAEPLMDESCASDMFTTESFLFDMPVADTLAVGIRTAADSLSATETLPVLKYTNAAEMFGNASTAVLQPATATAALRDDGRINGVADDPIFQSLLLGTLVICIAIATRYKREIVSLTGKMFGGRLSDDYATGRRHDIIPKQFLDNACIFGIFVISLIILRYVDAWLPERFSTTGLHIVPLSVLRISGVTALCMAYQYAALKIIGRISRETEFIDELRYVRRACFSVAATVVAPIFILAALSVGRDAEVWSPTLAVICVVLALLFIKETLALFMSKKIPFLHWFLYLCTVEAFPLTLVCASIARYQ